MTWAALSFFSTIFQLYQDDGMVILKDSVLLQGSNMVFHALTFARSRGRCSEPRPRFSTTPEGPGKRSCIGQQCLITVIA